MAPQRLSHAAWTLGSCPRRQSPAFAGVDSVPHAHRQPTRSASFAVAVPVIGSRNSTTLLDRQGTHIGPKMPLYGTERRFAAARDSFPYPEASRLKMAHKPFCPYPRRSPVVGWTAAAKRAYTRAGVRQLKIRTEKNIARLRHLESRKRFPGSANNRRAVSRTAGTISRPPCFRKSGEVAGELRVPGHSGTAHPEGDFGPPPVPPGPLLPAAALPYR